MNDVKDISRNIFDNIYTEINQCDYNLLFLQNKLDNKTEKYQQILINDTKLTFLNSINDYFDKINWIIYLQMN